ncbi:hypothetical protein PFISCL1PPCAC_28672, partial [Pristionchus fissidentatus]
WARSWTTSLACSTTIKLTTLSSTTYSRRLLQLRAAVWTTRTTGRRNERLRPIPSDTFPPRVSSTSRMKP